VDEALPKRPFGDGGRVSESVSIEDPDNDPDTDTDLDGLCGRWQCFAFNFIFQQFDT